MEQAIDYVVQSWFEATATTVQNCWRKTDILYDPQESNVPITTVIFDKMPTSTNVCTKFWRLYYCEIDEPIATENILEDIEIVEMVLADAEIEADRIEDSEEELEKSPPALVTVAGAFEVIFQNLISINLDSNIYYNVLVGLKY